MESAKAKAAAAAAAADETEGQSAAEAATTAEEEEEDQEATAFTTNVTLKLLEYSNASDKAVRYRLCQIVHLLMDCLPDGVEV